MATPAPLVIGGEPQALADLHRHLDGSLRPGTAAELAARRGLDVPPDLAFTTLLEDPAVVDLVLDRDVTIEACPTSNVHTGVIPSIEAHPLPRWLARGVRACVCPDNTLLSAVTAPEEHRRAARIPGMDDEKLRAVIAAAHAAAFHRP